MARNCRFRDLETYGSQPGNQRLPFIARIAGSQTLEYMSSKLSGYHCKAAGSQSLKLMVPNLKK